MAFSCAYLLRKIQESSLENGVSTNLIDKKSKSPEDESPIISEILNNLITDVCLSEVDIGCVYDEQSRESDIFINPDIDSCKENVDNDESFTNSKETREDLDCEIIFEDKSSYDEQFDFTQPPYQLTGAWSEFESDRINNYTRGCKWAPDGSCILTCSEDNILRIFNLPEELWDSSKWQDICEMESVLKISEGEIIYDFCWYPLMNSTDPCTCCFASCSKNSTVHLWDAFTGQLRCSYRTYDQVDEITAARSLSFESDGGRIFCGFEKYIRVFNINLPGRLYEERKVFDKKSGQPGIISCFAFTSANRNVSAAGSYQKTIGIYSEPDGNLEFILEGQKGGVTHLQFSPDGNLLFSGGRKDIDILCWDMRNLSQVLYCMRRCCLTNQRMYFDITRAGRYVISGNTNGIITIWDTQKETKSINDSLNILEPVQCYMGHNDCVNGISIHPTFPLLCSSSGQRKYPKLLSDDEEEMFTSKTIKSDNSLRLWWIGKNS